ncbi:hypothetical protein M2351_003704 [Azospirillum canadense]|nr:hypothetical protein [Azospirillum canadense]
MISSHMKMLVKCNSFPDYFEGTRPLLTACFP